jgi:homoserine kinase
MPRQNTAGVALLALRKALGLQHGFELVLHKGIALGSGMGGSAASCVAALVAANALLAQPLPRESLYGFALDGEAVASGSRHGDNLGSMLLGGLVLATHDRLLRIEVPADVALRAGASACGAGDAQGTRRAGWPLRTR